MKSPKPREGVIFGMFSRPCHFGETWLEAESFAYPKGGFTRRCRARLASGALRVVLCSIPDTCTTIPARLKRAGKTVVGYLTASFDDAKGVTEYRFNEYREASK